MYRLKRGWRNGTTDVVFEQQDLIAKLAALVPAPRGHFVRYHGVLGPAATWRPLIVPSANVDSTKVGCGYLASPEPSASASIQAEREPPESASRPRRNYSWSQLMKRV